MNNENLKYLEVKDLGVHGHITKISLKGMKCQPTSEAQAKYGIKVE